MVDGNPVPELRGRDRECEALDRLLESVWSGESRVLVLRGEPGAGKTALLDYVAGRASWCRIIRAAGVESEMELAYAGLHQVCSPALDHLRRLPTPQAEALRTALGLTPGGPPDRFLVALAVLSLLSAAAEEGPLVCLVDDAQWLDRVTAQSLTFVARRLLAERVALVFSVRESLPEEPLAGLPELVIRGLGVADARELLDLALKAPVDEQVRNRIIAETRGNPLALLEVPRSLTPAELAGGFGLSEAMPLVSRIEQGFLRRLERLPHDTRRLVLIAAAEPVGEVTILWRAAEEFGIGPEAAAAAESAGLIEVGARVRFRHPLVRSAACRAASARDLREVHHALAEATDPELDPDRRAWHRAHAAVRPDESVADELERSAARAEQRGGVAAAAAFLQRAAELTPDPARRAARALAAAYAKFETGASDAALELLATAESYPLDALQRARLERLRAHLIFARRRGLEAPPLLLDAARRLQGSDAGLARETCLEAFGAAIFAGRLADGNLFPEAAEAARAALAGSVAARAIDLLLAGLATRFTDGYVAALAPLRRALRVFEQEQEGGEAHLGWLLVASPVAHDVWDIAAVDRLTTRAVSLARDAGALTALPIALEYRAGAQFHSGDLGAVSASIAEAQAITEATGMTPLTYASMMLAAWRGQEARTSELCAAGMRDATARGEGRVIALVEYARAVLYNGLGRYAEALAAAERACAHEELGIFTLPLIELIEASSRLGRTDTAAAAVERLEERTSAAGTDWALGSGAGSRALLTERQSADALYREALERLRGNALALHRARVQLLYGEWLRREGRRKEARAELRTAHHLFSDFGAEAFARRAGGELVATGEKLRQRSVETRDELTPKEAQIARLASDGNTNPEIGARLFLSPRTVEWHLRKVFAKLDISSRRELPAALSTLRSPTMLT